MEHLHIHCMFNDVVRVNPTYVVTNSHAKKLQGDVLINEIVWEDETAFFFLLPALTFTVYMTVYMYYTVEPPESCLPQIPRSSGFSQGVQSLTRIEMSWP